MRLALRLELPFGFARGAWPSHSDEPSGVYWPIGHESEDPVVVVLDLRTGLLDPVAMATPDAVPSPREPCVDEDGAVEHPASGLVVRIGPATRGVRPGRIVRDARSPSILRTKAARDLERNAFESAETALRLALAVLPEYTEGWYFLAILLRRAGRLEEAAAAMVNAISHPRCFGGDRRRCLGWLAELPDEAAPSLADDPLFANRRVLAAVSGWPHDGHYPIYESAIRAYLAAGEGARAVALRILVGELMASEPILVRARHAYSDAAHFQRLASELRAAGFEARAAALRAAMAEADRAPSEG